MYYSGNLHPKKAFNRQRNDPPPDDENPQSHHGIGKTSAPKFPVV
jgi:hypothetical protein